MLGISFKYEKATMPLVVKKKHYAKIASINIDFVMQIFVLTCSNNNAN